MGKPSFSSAPKNDVALGYHFMLPLLMSHLPLPLSPLQLHVEVDLITNCPSECVQSGLALARSLGGGGRGRGHRRSNGI